MKTIYETSSKKRDLVFFVLGDMGSGDRNQKAVARYMEKRCREIEKLDGLIFLGDNIYPDGAKNAYDPAFVKMIEDPYRSRCLAKASFYPVLGNHDYQGSPQAQVAYSKLNPRWKMPNRFYSVHFNSFLNLIAIDSNKMDLCFDSNRCGLDFFLDKSLNSNAKWTVVLSHYPLTSASKKGHIYTGTNLLSYLLKKVSCQKVDAWLSGHSHHLEQRALTGCPTSFFISGAGGAQLHDPHLGQKESLFVKKDFGFLELDFKEDHFVSRFFTKEGLQFKRENYKSL